MMRRRRRTVVVAALALAVVAGAAAMIRLPLSDVGRESDEAAASQSEEQRQDNRHEVPSYEPVPSDQPTDPPVIESGSGEWTTAEGETDEVGDDGQRLAYHVAVEDDIELDVDEFADEVDRILGEEDRGWTAGGDWRLRRADPEDPADFTIFLSSPVTTASQCSSPSPAYYSCRSGDNVIINAERWIDAVDFWPEDRVVYREYLINHEVGHRLGHGHVVCPGEGEPSPVMAQQTVELRGCEPNGWPYLDGEFVDGPDGEYL